ncbi:MAG TPA: MBL fold metallo-hydrolase [Blastocatellia bacterium]|nr:MBL fold metallo-hydrolase [Blastocatellia bacterium]HMV82351.1 MBL fold metallo-hydrolase [Blastocatellia bacterium]HMY72547.1 MBL fold metallo-hydrolase [Blastocatellia bacterium]HMZ18957.1 MBL fold metallo-hydrolase [Blastocatellia bacterium]HNG30338.1 MBL fold metallo-hydrolase [Blastocatellia bacterium]
MQITFLGTGTSVGIPMIGCTCAVCQSDDPRDKRLRTGLLVENEGRRLVIDVSADFRQQALREKLDRLDALLITHCHADHVFGLDDVRPFNFRHGAIPLYASEITWKNLRRVFGYIFEATHVGGGLPQLTPHTIDGDFAVCGLRVTPFDVIHGKLPVTGFRFSDGQRSAAFITDCNFIPEESLAKLHGLDLLIIDALQFKPHPTHLHLDQTLNYIAGLKPRHALLTHMGHQFKHSEIQRMLPAGVEPAYDGLRLEL